MTLIGNNLAQKKFVRLISVPTLTLVEQVQFEWVSFTRYGGHWVSVHCHSNRFITNLMSSSVIVKNHF